MKEECRAVQGFYICELPAGHTCRHREAGHTWLDKSVADAHAKQSEICGARCPNENGGPDFICQLPPHKLYPAAKHRDNRNDGSMSWTQGGADRIAAELAAKQKVS